MSTTTKSVPADFKHAKTVCVRKKVYLVECIIHMFMSGIIYLQKNYVQKHLIANKKLKKIKYEQNLSATSGGNKMREGKYIKTFC